MTIGEDDTEAVDAQLQLYCTTHRHLITTLLQTGPGADLEEIIPPPRRTWQHDNDIFEKLCPKCEQAYGRPMRYALPVDSIRQRMSEVPKGTVGQCTLASIEEDHRL
jgi:hypothetical protein